MKSTLCKECMAVCEAGRISLDYHDITQESTVVTKMLVSLIRTALSLVYTVARGTYNN